MKQILRLFAVVGVVLLAALISAGSCDKKDPDNKNTNTNNNSGGGGNGGGNTNTNSNIAATIKVTFPTAAAMLAKRSGVADIVLKASDFPTTVAGAAAVGMDTVNAANANTRKAAFSFEFDGATGGLTIVDNISKVGNSGVTMSLPTAAALAAADKDGVKVVTRTTVEGTTPAGMNIVGIFANQTAPASTGEVVATVAPFAFTASANTQPILWCVSTLTGITAAATATSTLAGGQKADCYVASVGANALGGATDSAAWLGTGGNFKTSVGIAVVSVKTDAKTIPNIGLTGTDDAAKVAAFNDGITSTELQQIMAGAGGASNIAVGTFIVKILSDGDWTSAPAIVNPPANP